MFGDAGTKLMQKIDAIKRFLDSMSSIGSYVITVLGITSAAAAAWFREQIFWFWSSYGLFHTWRGAVGLTLIAVGTIFILKDRTVVTDPTNRGTSSQDSSPRDESPLVWDDHLGHTYSSNQQGTIFTSAIKSAQRTGLIGRSN
jgi:hypothetical protein